MAPVNYITAKLRKDKFLQLIEDMQKAGGFRARSCNSMICACVFFTHHFLTHQYKDDKKMVDIVANSNNLDMAGFVAEFRNHYYDFLESKTSAEFFEKIKDKK